MGDMEALPLLAIPTIPNKVSPNKVSRMGEDVGCYSDRALAERGADGIIIHHSNLPRTLWVRTLLAVLS